MVRSIHAKLIMIMILLILSLMTVVGAFLVNSVSAFYLDDFYTQMQTVFSDRTLVRDLCTQTPQEENGGEMIAQVLSAYSGSLGIDGRNRRFYVLDGETGIYLAGSDGTADHTIDYTRNLLLALQEKVTGDTSNMTMNYMDLAIPITRGQSHYVVYIYDGKETVSALVNQIVFLILEALVFALVISVLLSFLLSKTMVNPLRRLTKGAMELAQGDFSRTLEVSSRDEIGILTDTFNGMARQLVDTLDQVEQERDKLDTLFLHMNDGVLAFSQSGQLIHANPAAELFLRRTLTLETSFYQGLMGEVAPFETVLDTPDCINGELEVHGKFLQVTLAPLDRSRQGERTRQGGVLAVIRDVTDQKENEKLQREFVANVSHELRTPITNIKSYAETLMESGAHIDPKTEQKFLGVIVGESDRMTHIVQDLLTLSRFDSSHAEMKYTLFSFSAAVEELYNAVFMECNRRRHTLTLNLEEQLPEITGDRPRILQVMMNITSNAIKYTPDGGHITLTAGRASEGRVFLSVEDDGIGIPPEDRPRIFQRFYRVDKARSRQSGGTGLGLAIAQEIVQNHGGSLALQDKDTPGLMIRMELEVHLDVELEQEELL